MVSNLQNGILLKMFFIHFTILKKQAEGKNLDAQQKREWIKRSAAQEENIEELKNNEIKLKIFIFKNLNILIKNYRNKFKKFIDHQSQFLKAASWNQARLCSGSRVPLTTEGSGAQSESGGWRFWGSGR